MKKRRTHPVSLWAGRAWWVSAAARELFSGRGEQREEGAVLFVSV